MKEDNDWRVWQILLTENLGIPEVWQLFLARWGIEFPCDPPLKSLIRTSLVKEGEIEAFLLHFIWMNTREKMTVAERTRRIKEAFSEWCEMDDALYQLAHCFGFFHDAVGIRKVGVLECSNEFCDAIGYFKMTLIDMGLLEENADGLVRWNASRE